MLELRGVSKSYGQLDALHAIDLRVPDGQTVVLIGPSGSGKSTLLRLMIGLIWPDAGSVLLDGTQLTPANTRSIRHQMGYVIQDGGLFPHLNARQNITLMARYLGRPVQAVRACVDKLAELTRFPLDALDRFPIELSGGQRQRVSLMRALMLDPDVLLLDEPLAALDPMIRADLQADLRRIFQTVRKTVVLVTHDMNEALFFGETIVLLRAGRIVQEGSPRQLVHAPADPFVAQFINAQCTPRAPMGGAPA